MTDRERKTCYEAELTVFPKRFAASYEARQWLPNHVADYVHAVQGRECFKAAFPNRTRLMNVCAGKNQRGSYTNVTMSPPRLVIGECHRKMQDECEWVTLHELAHAVTRRSDPGHGPRWRRNYIVLVRFQLGYRAARYLRDAFKIKGLSA